MGDTYPTEDSCANVCKYFSSMFIYGTNDFGEERCFADGCSCFCETSAMPNGTCNTTSHMGFLLYKYESSKFLELQKCIVFCNFSCNNKVQF